MRASAIFAFCFSLAATGCSASSTDHTYALQGQILSVASDHQQAVIKHGAIKGLMPGMTMPYKVREQRWLDNITPGDLIEATLVVASNDAYLTSVTKVGQAPLENLSANEPPPVSSVDLLKT